MRKLTLNLGVRYTKFNGHVPATTLPAGPWVPERDFPEVKNSPNFTNLSPRFGLVLRSVRQRQDGAQGVAGPLHAVRHRGRGHPGEQPGLEHDATWTDSNGNYVPDCNLLNSATNGECGAWDELSFGQVARAIRTARPTR